MAYPNGGTYNMHPKKKIAFSESTEHENVYKTPNRTKSPPATPQSEQVRPTCSENMSDFLETTTFHGLKFVGDANISYFERFLFLVSFIVSFSVATYFIFDVYAKWDRTPVIVGINPYATSITKIPFPAVTICNMNQAMKSKVSKLVNDTLHYGLLLDICDREDEIDYDRIENAKFNDSTTWKVFESFMIEVSQPCKQMALYCTFGGLKYVCADIFQQTLTDEGLCCTFNMLSAAFFWKQTDFTFSNNFLQGGAIPVNWTPEAGYPEKLPKKFYPRPAVGIGVTDGLSVILDAEIDEYYCSSTNGAGFKISVHSPSETPTVRETGIIVPTGVEARIRLEFQKSDSSSSIRPIKQKYRQCIFDDEDTLTAYSCYSQRNCNMECDAQLLTKKCKCIEFFMPKIYENSTICGLKDLRCTESFESNNGSEDWINQHVKECNEMCLPACFELNYRGDLFMSPINTGTYRIKNKAIELMSQKYVKRSITILNFFYKLNSFHPDLKDQFIGMTEFLSYTGGLMGLFLGFSTISIIEIFYFCTFRPFCASYRYRKDINSVKPIKSKVHDKTLVINLEAETFNRSMYGGNFKPNGIKKMYW